MKLNMPKPEDSLAHKVAQRKAQASDAGTAVADSAGISAALSDCVTDAAFLYATTYETLSTFPQREAVRALSAKFAAIENDTELKTSVESLIDDLDFGPDAVDCPELIEVKWLDLHRALTALQSLCPRLGEPE